MDGAIEALRKEFAGLRTGRASTALLEHINVDAYGSKMPMNQVASISVPEPRLLTVQVWDNSLVKEAEKAIRESDLGLNPHFGDCRNPYDRATGRVPGGSSSGAAVSVADGMAAAGLGTDTAGSVRVPVNSGDIVTPSPPAGTCAASATSRS